MALVSGGGRGMGFGIAQALAVQGAHVVVNDFHPERAQSAESQLRESGLKASAQAADLSDRDAIFAMVQRFRDETGVVDIFVHNAGIPAQGRGCTPFLQSPESEWSAWLQLNLHGLMHACQALLPALQPYGGSSREGPWSFMKPKNCRAGERQSQATATLAAPTALPL